jgi:hypothetical protein
MSIDMLRTDTARSVIAGEVAAWAKFAAQFTKATVRLLNDLLPTMTRVAEVLSEPRVPHYEAYLIEIGYQPSEARFLSIWATRSARRQATELDTRRRELGTAMRKLSDAADGSMLVLAGSPAAASTAGPSPGSRTASRKRACRCPLRRSVTSSERPQRETRRLALDCAKWRH